MVFSWKAVQPDLSCDFSLVPPGTVWAAGLNGEGQTPENTLVGHAAAEGKPLLGAHWGAAGRSRAVPLPVLTEPVVAAGGIHDFQGAF